MLALSYTYWYNFYTENHYPTLTNSCGLSHKQVDTPGLDCFWMPCDIIETTSNYANVLGTNPDLSFRSNLLP